MGPRQGSSAWFPHLIASSSWWCDFIKSELVANQYQTKCNGFLRVLPCLEFTNSILLTPRIFLRHCTPLAPATPPFPLCYLFVCCSFSMSVEFNNQYGTRIGHKSESSEAPSCGFNSGRGSPRPGSGVSLGSCARRPRLPCPLRRVLLR